MLAAPPVFPCQSPCHLLIPQSQPARHILRRVIMPLLQACERSGVDAAVGAQRLDGHGGGCARLHHIVCLACLVVHAAVPGGSVVGGQR